MAKNDLFTQVLARTTDGMKILFTPDNIAPGDDFLILNDGDVCEVTVHKSRVPYWLEFSNDEPIRLEDVPESFLRSILKNV